MWIEVDEYPSELLAASEALPNNDFVVQCQKFYDTVGYLTEKQLNGLRTIGKGGYYVPSWVSLTPTRVSNVSSSTCDNYLQQASYAVERRDALRQMTEQVRNYCSAFIDDSYATPAAATNSHNTRQVWIDELHRMERESSTRRVEDVARAMAIESMYPVTHVSLDRHYPPDPRGYVIAEGVRGLDEPMPPEHNYYTYFTGARP
jgi:hypothetical protein